MPWQEVSTMSLRQEFVALAAVDGANRRQLCRQFGISPKTGYKWLHRAQAADFQDRSRRPQHSPARTSDPVETAVLALRQAHPAWGGRKLRAWLQAHGQPAPAASTITAILRRHRLLAPSEATTPHAWQRYEAAAPNQLWQLDFKGHLPLAGGSLRCHPLTALDDHSRFAVVLAACPDERTATVREVLIGAFRRYGLPDRMLMDNGSPWGDTLGSPYTPLTVWLLKLGIAVSHGRPYHPQTQGKEERFHRTLKAEVLQRPPFPDLVVAQQAFDRWRTSYNTERPHEALGLTTPANRYRVSGRPFPTRLPEVAYGPDAIERKVQEGGWFSFRGQFYHVSKAFRGERIGLRPTATEGVFGVYFAATKLREVDLREPT
jgi:transposase InsO family protein